MLAIDDINERRNQRPQMQRFPRTTPAMPRQRAGGSEAAQQSIVASSARVLLGCNRSPRGDTLHRNGTSRFITAASSNPKFTEQGYGHVFRMSAVTMRSARGRELHEGLAQAGKDRDHAPTTPRTPRRGRLGQAGAQSTGMTVTYFDAITQARRLHRGPRKVATTKPDVLFYTGYTRMFGLLAKE